MQTYIYIYVYIYIYDGCQTNPVLNLCIVLISICLKGCCFFMCSAIIPQEQRKRSRKQNLCPCMSCRYACMYACMHACMYACMHGRT